MLRRRSSRRPATPFAAPLAAAAAALCLAAAPLAGAAPQDRPGDSQESTVTVRTATDEELKQLLDDFDEAEKSKEHGRVAAALERMTAFDNPELVKAAKDGLAYKPSKRDKDDAKAEAESLGMDDKRSIERLLEVRTAEVVDAAARLCVSIGDEKSFDLLVKALKDKDLWQSPPRIRAVVEGLAHHPHGGDDGDEPIRELLFSIDRDDYAGDKWDYDDPDAEVPGYDYVGKYGAAIRYFGLRRTKDFETVMYIANLLNAPSPGYVDSPDNPPAAYWKARFQTWQRYNREVVWTLKQITGQTWKPGYPDEGGEGEVAKQWIRERKDDLGLE